MVLIPAPPAGNTIFARSEVFRKLLEQKKAPEDRPKAGAAWKMCEM
jgi:hypothetical protein